MKWIIVIAFIGALVYFFGQPILDKTFGKVTSQYDNNVETNTKLK